MATPFNDDAETVIGPKTPVAQGPCTLCTYCGNTSPDDDEFKFACHDEVKKYRHNRIAQLNKPVEERTHEPCNARDPLPDGAQRVPTSRLYDSDNESDDEARAANCTEGSTVANRGALHSFASSIIRIVLCAARMCRCDLLRPSNTELMCFKLDCAERRAIVKINKMHRLNFALQPSGGSCCISNWKS